MFLRKLISLKHQLLKLISKASIIELFFIVFILLICEQQSNIVNASKVMLSNIELIKSSSEINNTSSSFSPQLTNLSNIIGTRSMGRSYNDVRTQYDTPDPIDSENINNFRVKTKPESIDEIKARLKAGDVYQQIQDISTLGKTVYVDSPNELLAALWNIEGNYEDLINSPNFKIPNDSVPVTGTPITHIVLTKDIVITQGKTVKDYQDFSDFNGLTRMHIPNRGIVLDGTDATGVKHTLEINGPYENARINLWSDNYTSTFVMNNINLRGTDWYGVVSAYSSPNKRIIYRNITYQGSQLAASYASNVTFAGYDDVKSVTSYQQLAPKMNTDAQGNPIKDSNGRLIYTVIKGNIAYANGFVPSNVSASGIYNSQQIMECNNVTFAYNCYFIGNTPNDVCLYLGYKNDNKSDINVMDRATVNLTASNQGSQEFSETSVICLRNGKMEIHPHAIVNLKALSFKTPEGSTDTSDGNKPNSSHRRNLIQLDPSSTSANPPTSFIIDDYATVNAQKDGPLDTSEKGLVYISSGASLTVGKWANLKITSTNADNDGKLVGDSATAKPVLYMEDKALVTVDQPGTFDLRGDGEFTSNRSLIQLGNNSTFKFGRSRMVNIEYDGHQSNTNLISMSSGIMQVENMDVYAWKRNNPNSNVAINDDPFNTGLEARDFEWNSVFNFLADYNSSGFTGLDLNAVSLYPSTLEDMKKNYNTNNFQRVTFRYIPTVYITQFTSQPVDDPSDVNSRQLFGRVVTDDINHPDGDYLGLADAYIRINGHVTNKFANADQPINNPIAPDPNWVDLSGSGLDIKSNFSAKTDKNGYFTVETTKENSFMASDPDDLLNKNKTSNGRLQAFAFKDGNYTYSNIAVLDKVPPQAKAASMRYAAVGATVPSPDNFIDKTSLSDFNSATKSNGFTSKYIYKYDARNLASDSTFWGTTGIKDVYVNVSDPSGNVTTVKSQVNIKANPIFIKAIKQKAIVKVPEGSDTWTNEEWKSWIKENNPNGVSVEQVNPDGSITDLSEQVTNNATKLKLGENMIQYQFLLSDGTALSETGIIELRTDTLKLQLPLNNDHTGTAPINFGRYGSYNTGYLRPKETISYPINVIDDRVNQTNDWKLELKANLFTDSKGNSISSEKIGLGLLTPDNTFANLFSEQLLSTATGNKTMDLLNGSTITENQILAIKRPAVDSKLNGLDYTSTLTWTLFDTTP